MSVETVPLTEYDRDQYRSQRTAAQLHWAHASMRKSALSKVFNKEIETLESIRRSAIYTGDQVDIDAAEQSLGRFVARTNSILQRHADRISEQKKIIESSTKTMRDGSHETYVSKTLDPWCKRMRLFHAITGEILCARLLSFEEAKCMGDRDTMFNEAKPEPLWDNQLEEPDQLTKDILAGVPQPIAIERFRRGDTSVWSADSAPLSRTNQSVRKATEEFAHSIKSLATDLAGDSSSPVTISLISGGTKTVLATSEPTDSGTPEKKKRGRKKAA